MPKNKETSIQSEVVDSPWMLEFDGSCRSSGSRVGIVLVSPTGQTFPSSFKLSFENMNNTTKYEALLLGLGEAKKKHVKLLKEKGDEELIVK